MHYWNQSNFEGLRALAAELGRHPDLVALAEYCRLRDAGLRREAFAALDAFLTATRDWDAPRARQAVDTILAMHLRTTDCHQFLVQPLMDRLVDPVLEQWLRDVPDALEPARWLGILRRDRAQLARVLAAQPGDVLARRLLVDGHLANVDHATHHLGEGVLLGELADAQDEIARADALIAAAPDRAPFADLEDDARTFRRMLSDWQDYSASPAGTFPDWCAARGHRYGWPVAVYYADGASS